MSLEDFSDGSQFSGFNISMIDGKKKKRSITFTINISGPQTNNGEWWICLGIKEGETQRQFMIRKKATRLQETLYNVDWYAELTKLANALPYEPK